MYRHHGQQVNNRSPRFHVPSGRLVLFQIQAQNRREEGRKFIHFLGAFESIFQTTLLEDKLADAEYDEESNQENCKDDSWQNFHFWPPDKR